LKRLLSFSLLLFLLAGAGFSTQAYSQEAPPPDVNKQNPALVINLAVMDVEQILRQANVVKDIRGQVNKYRNALQADIQKEEEELRNANQTLARQRTIMAPEAFAEERKKFETRLANVQRKLQESKQNLENTHLAAMRKVEKAMGEVVKEITEEARLILILRKGQVVMSAKDMDITAVVLERLNKKISSIKVDPPEEAKAGK
jgi:outer membrane protein